MRENNRRRKNLVFLTIFLVMTHSLLIQGQTFTQASPSDSNFFIDSLQVFYPGSKLTLVQSQHGKGELTEELKDSQIYRFSIKAQGYQFPLLIQVKDGVVLDFLFRLPSYFSHDTFHQGLLDRMGKQDHYFKKENTAIYRWNNTKNHRIYYTAACTLVCFPVSLAGMIRLPPSGLKSYIPLFYRFETFQSP